MSDAIRHLGAEILTYRTFDAPCYGTLKCVEERDVFSTKVRT